VSAVARRLEQVGIRCWVLPSFRPQRRATPVQIVRAIEAAPVMVVVVSGEANHSEHVPHELEAACNPVAPNHVVVVVPFRIDSIEPTEELVHCLAVEDRVDAVSPPLESHIAWLVEVVLGILRNTSATTREQTPGDVSPADAANLPPRNGLRAPSLAGTAGDLGRGD
jgi:TIR domain